MPWAMLTLYVLWAFTGALSWHNNNELVERERRDVALTRDGLYRICERAERTKANVHRGFPVGSKTRKFLELRLPIVDCRANLRGEPATAMSRRQMRAYVDRFVNGELRPLPETPRRP